MKRQMMMGATLWMMACGSGSATGTTPGQVENTTSTTTTADSQTTTTTTTATTTTTFEDDCLSYGTEVGDCALDFELLDAQGQPWRLSDYRGDVILVDFSAMWCPICQNGASTFEQLGEDYGDQGFTSVTVLFQNVSSGQPSASDLQDWADSFGLQHPVLADDMEQTFEAYDAGYQPTVVVIGRDFRITWVEKATAAVNGAEAAVLDAL